MNNTNDTIFVQVFYKKPSKKNTFLLTLKPIYTHFDSPTPQTTENMIANSDFINICNPSNIPFNYNDAFCHEIGSSFPHIKDWKRVAGTPSYRSRPNIGEPHAAALATGWNKRFKRYTTEIISSDVKLGYNKKYKLRVKYKRKIAINVNGVIQPDTLSRVSNCNDKFCISMYKIQTYNPFYYFPFCIQSTDTLPIFTSIVLQNDTNWHIIDTNITWTSTDTSYKRMIVYPKAVDTVSTTRFILFESIELKPNETATITSSNANPICANTPITLTASLTGNYPNITYKWNNNQTTSQIQVTPLVTTTYTCTITYATYSKAVVNYVVTVNPLPYTNAGNDTSICAGYQVTLGSPAIAGNTYKWTPITYLNNPYAAQPVCTPSANTNYKLEVTNITTSCKASDYVNVYVNNNFYIIGDTLACNSSVYTIQNYNSAISYKFYLDTTRIYPLLNYPYFTINWANYDYLGGTLKVVAIASSKCQREVSKYIYPCCAGSTKVYKDYTVAPAETLNISGTFTIIGNFTILGYAYINGCNVKMSKDSKIIVKDGGILHLNKPSVLKSCDDINMWEGIYIDGTMNEANGLISKLIVTDYVTIKDAKTAINACNNANLEFNFSNNTIFDRNYKNIVITNYNNIDFTNCIYCNSNIYMVNTSTLLKPYNGKITYVGIELNNVTNAYIGKIIGVSAFSNIFQNMNYGIKTSYCANLTVYNCYFKNITALAGETNSGTGIYFNGNRGSSTNFNLNIGNTASNNYPNKFENCKNGVYVNSFANVYNKYNTYINCLNGHKTESSGNYMYNNVTYNNFDNCESPINCRNTGITYTGIANNTITKTKYGIAVQNVTPLAANVSISNNNISFVNTSTATVEKTGILVTNVNGNSDMKAYINTNTIDMTNTDTTTLNYGIRVQSSNKSAISNNNVTRTGNAISVAKALNLNGIAVETSSEFEMCNNTTNNLGNGMRFNGNMLSCKLIQNINNNSKFGIQMDNAFIGNQGYSNIVNDNQWINDIQHPCLYRINGSATAIMYWFVRNSSNYNIYPVSQYLNQYILPVPYSNPTINSCSNNQNLMYENVINDNIAYNVNPEENEYIGKEIVYNTLKDDPAKYEELANTNPDFTTFYIETELNNIGKIKDVTDKIEAKEYIEAETKIDEFIPESEIEAARKTVYSIYLDSWAKERYELTESEYFALLDVASKKPDLYGSCVFTARVMLGIEGNSMETLRYRDTTSTTKEATEIRQENLSSSEKYYFINKLYPNPAKNSLNLSYNIKPNDKCILQIFDLSGKEIMNKVFDYNSNKAKIDISNIKDGVYYYKIVNNNEIIINDKFVIIKN